MTQEKQVKENDFLSSKWANILANLALAALYFWFVYMNVNVLLVGFKLSVLLLLIFNSFIAVLALTRRTPKSFSRSPFDFIVTLCGTLSPMLFLGVPEASDHIFLLFMQIIGISFSFAGLVSLNRSFGLIPADRGIVTTGLYGFVRHPLYSGYILLFFSCFLQNFSMRNLVVLVIFLIFESLRLLIEEGFYLKTRNMQPI